MFGGDDAGDASQVVGYADISPVGQIEERLDRGKAVVAKFEDQEAARLQVPRRLCDQFCVKFVAFFASVKGELRLVLADFALQRFFFVPADVRRIANDQIKEM